MSIDNSGNFRKDSPLKENVGFDVEQIVLELNPKTLLYLGKDLSSPISAFRQQGVQAYGMNGYSQSVYELPEEIRSYCSSAVPWKGLPKGFPKTYDLVIVDGVLEAIYEEESSLLVKKLAKWSEQIILKQGEKTAAGRLHLSGQEPIDYLKQFAQQNIYRSLSSFSKIGDDCIFLKRQEDFTQVIENYEGYFSRAKQDLRQLAEENQNLKEEGAQYSGSLNQYYQLKQEFNSLYKKYSNLRMELKSLRAVQGQYQAIQGSASWKLTKPLRVFLNLIKKIVRKFKNSLFMAKKGLKYWKQYGFKLFIKKARMHRKYAGIAKTYILRNLPNKNEQQAERETIFEHPVKFSILVPLYNTPEKFLREMIESVQAQTYPNWELCLADGSDAQHAYVGKVSKNYANADDRILYRKLEQNLGISENTNECIKMATGDYIGLFDHDDVLHPSLLFEVMTAIEEHHADFIYTDETTFEGNILNPITVHLKPDFAIDNLRANNYICHFSCFKRELLDQAGWFRDECNGSQDFDLVLRLTEKAKKVYHIRRVLYFWRSHPGSVAQDLANKPYCVDAAKLAIHTHLERNGIHGAKVDLAPKLQSAYRIDYPIIGEPLISIIIPNHNHHEDLFRCVNSILTKSSYNNYEIIIVENGRSDGDTYAVYQALQRDKRVKIVKYSGEFNYPLVNEQGVRHARGEYLLFLNNDTEVISSDWIEQMLMMAQREDVGAVGAKLYFENGSIQHCGIALGIGVARTAGHIYYALPDGKNEIGYMGRLVYQQNMSAVTAACMMVSKEKYLEVGGFDPDFKVAYNDVDFCLKLRGNGYVNVFTPYAELYHYESLSRGSDKLPENQARFHREEAMFKKKWEKVLKAGDPYYPQDFDKDYNAGMFNLCVQP